MFRIAGFGFLVRLASLVCSFALECNRKQLATLGELEMFASCILDGWFSGFKIWEGGVYVRFFGG